MSELASTTPPAPPPAAAALVSLALFGAYVTRAGITLKDSSILDPEVGSLVARVHWSWLGFTALGRG